MKKLALAELNRISVEEFKSAPKTPIIIVLDNIRSLNNIGSVFRTADAFRIDTICLCGITGTPPNKEIHKTALGATESVTWKYYESTTEAIQELKRNNTIVYAVEQAEGSISLDEFNFNGDNLTAFVFGNEVLGVDEAVMQLVDGCIEIPQFGTKHSLNIAVTVGIVMWDLFKSYYQKQP